VFRDDIPSQQVRRNAPENGEMQLEECSMSTTRQVRKTPATGRRAASKPRDKPGRTRSNGETALNEDQRRHMVAEAAYYRALRRGFAAGGEVDDWLTAEREINQHFRG
jgi:hypothetical protein